MRDDTHPGVSLRLMKKRPALDPGKDRSNYDAVVGTFWYLPYGVSDEVACVQGFSARGCHGAFLMTHCLLIFFEDYFFLKYKYFLLK